MRAAFLSFLKTRRQLAVYCLIGLTGVTLDYVSFFGMVNWLSVHYLAANAISTSLGIVNNFFLNRFFNFKVHDRWLIRLISFYCVGLAGLAVSSLILYAFVSQLQFNPNGVKVFAIVIVVLLQYNLNRLVSFKT